MSSPFRGTTICAVRRNGQIAIAGDGQVTMGEHTIFKTTARKVRRLYNGEVVVGFAGSVADAFTLCEKFEEKLAILKNWQNQILELHENGVSEEDILEQLFGGEAFPGIASKGYLSRTQFIHQIIYGEPAFYPEYFEDFRLK